MIRFDMGRSVLYYHLQPEYRINTWIFKKKGLGRDLTKWYSINKSTVNVFSIVLLWSKENKKCMPSSFQNVKHCFCSCFKANNDLFFVNSFDNFKKFFLRFDCFCSSQRKLNNFENIKLYHQLKRVLKTIERRVNLVVFTIFT